MEMCSFTKIEAGPSDTPGEADGVSSNSKDEEKSPLLKLVENTLVFHCYRGSSDGDCVSFDFAAGIAQRCRRCRERQLVIFQNGTRMQFSYSSFMELAWRVRQERQHFLDSRRTQDSGFEEDELMFE